MTAEVHFVQAGDGPVLIGAGEATLDCACGRVLVERFDPRRFLAIGIQCGQCGTVTTTPPLPEGALPPRSAVIAAPSAEPRITAMTVPSGVSVVGQAEMARLQGLFQPASPDNAYQVSDALLDEAAATFERHVDGPLPELEPDGPFAGLQDHALAWSIRHLRGRLRSEGWACMDDGASVLAVTQLTAFLHFGATWSRHPLFPAMVATAAERGFSLHGLAPFAAAHCLMMLGNRIRFPDPEEHPNGIEGFEIVSGPDQTVAVHVGVLDRFSFPFGQPWDPAGQQAAVSEMLAAEQGRINLRNPGVLVVSTGAAPPGFDQALLGAVAAGLDREGRRNRGLLAVASLMLRVQALPDPRTVRFGYGFAPVVNRHFRGENPIQVTAQP